MNWITLCEHAASCSVEDFYSGVDVWLKRPNVVNKRLLGAVIVAENDRISLGGSVDGDVVRGRQSMVVLAQLYCKELHNGEGDPEVQSAASLKGMVRELLPKMRSSSRGLEAVLTDLTNHSVVFCPLPSIEAVPIDIPASSYRLQFSPAPGQDCNADNISASRIYLQIRGPPHSPEVDTGDPHPAAPNTHSAANGITVPTCDWLRMVLLPKIAQWSEESSQQKQLQVGTAIAGDQCRGRRGRGESLIPLGRYSQLYAELKEKYGPTLVQSWPEGTDPHKFVYEDIAIGTYLLVLWEGERKELGLTQKQSFIDLGCGNGLLVYLLTSEGHPGKGIDLRERKIWKMYKDRANLEVCSLVPSASTTFPGFDWLIGNHSDELTPWIPLMAARSSYSTRYFVLPCCAHDFNKRFTRPSTGRSQYQCYLDYVREIGERMGFVVREDTLRIPSSKRICQVGMKRSYPSSKETTIDKQRMEFLMKRCGSNPGHTHHSCDDHTTSTGESNLKLSKNVVSSREEHHQLQLLEDGSSANSTSIYPPPPRTRTRPGNNPSSSQGHGEEPGGHVGTGVSSHGSNSQHFDEELCQVQPQNDSVLSPPCLHVVNHGSLSQWHGEIQTSLTSSGGVRNDVSSLLSLETGFKPRDPTEVVRNCSRINREVKKVIVDTLTRQLLQTENYIIVYRFQDGQHITTTFSKVAESSSFPLSSCEGISPPPPPPASVRVQQHASASNTPRQKQEEQQIERRGTLHSTSRTTSERGKHGESHTNGDEPELKHQCCNDDDSECTIVCCHGGEKQLCQQSEGEGDCEKVKWNLGGKIHLSEAAKLFDSGLLSQLKKEYGGLQTLLRNEHQVFKVCGGYIQLRNWSERDHHGPRRSAKPLSRNQKEAKGLLLKTKLCWFHSNHPQGCPRHARDCPYAHGEDELRERPNFREILDCSKELVFLA